MREEVCAVRIEKHVWHNPDTVSERFQNGSRELPQNRLQVFERKQRPEMHWFALKQKVSYLNDKTWIGKHVLSLRDFFFAKKACKEFFLLAFLNSRDK